MLDWLRRRYRYWRFHECPVCSPARLWYVEFSGDTCYNCSHWIS